MTELNNLIEAVQRGDVEQVAAILQDHSELIHKRDDRGATPLHHAAFAGRRDVVRLLVEKGAEINTRDSGFGATPTGWAIEYLRELGGFLSIELADLSFAIQRGDVEWMKRFLGRFPALRRANDAEGRPFKRIAEETGNPEIAGLFLSDHAEQVHLRRTAKLRKSTTVFLVGNIEPTMEWYKQLGFESEYYPPGFAILRRDEIEIFLQQQPGYAAPDDPGRRKRQAWDVYIVTDNVKSLYAEFSALPGVTISRPLCPQGYGMMEFDVMDLNGHRLVFAQPM